MDATHAIGVIDKLLAEYGTTLGQTGAGMVLRHDLTVVRDRIAELRSNGDGA